MKNILKLTLVFVLLLVFINCNTKNEKPTSKEKKTTIEMVTDKGTILLELYNETPKHRDNFIKLAKEGAYDSLLFHRVINTFMIQGGDPDSKFAEPNVQLGNGDRPYKVDAEFRPNLFHKKGALAAARDGNPERASSAMQFYIVQGKVKNDSLIDIDEKRINRWLATHYSNQLPENKALFDSLQQAIANEDYQRYLKINKELEKRAENFTDFQKYTIPEEHRKVYRTLGGTPHLDQNYTVFGQVIEGLNVVDSIAAVKVDVNNRPINDIRIQSIKVIE